MAVLWINEGYQPEFDRKINAYLWKMDSLSRKYDRAMTYTDGYFDRNISNCNIYLKKRKRSFQQYKDEAVALQRSVHTYAQKVLDKDLAISRKIHADSYAFYQHKHIGPQNDNGMSRFWNTIGMRREDFWLHTDRLAHQVGTDIKEFYKAHKYEFSLVKDVASIVGGAALLLVSAPTPFGVLCIFGGAWAIAKGAHKLCVDGRAVWYHLKGDDAAAEIESKRTLSKDLVEVGELSDTYFHTDFFETFNKTILVELEVCQMVAELEVAYRSLMKLAGFKNCSSLDPVKSGSQTWNENIGNLKKIKFFGTKSQKRLGSPETWGKLILHGIGFSVATDPVSKKDSLAKQILTIADQKTEQISKNIETSSEYLNGGTFWGDMKKRSPLLKPIYERSDSIAEICME